DGRVGLDVEEVAGAQVLVAVGVAGVDAGSLDLEPDAAVGRVLLVEVDVAGVVGELAADGRDHRVLRGEAEPAVRRVDVVAAGQGLDLAGGTGGVGGGHGAPS